MVHNVDFIRLGGGVQALDICFALPTKASVSLHAMAIFLYVITNLTNR